MMNNLPIKFCVATLIALQLSPVGAAAPNAVKVAQADANIPLCKKDLTQYLETLRFLRATAGDQIASRVASGYVSEVDLERVAAAEGPCAATQMLRDKKALR